MVVYGAFVLFAILASAFVWNEKVNGILYYCSERNPLDFLIGPPFTHSRSWTTGDHDAARPETVLLLWRAVWAGCFLAPAILVWTGRKVAHWVGRRLPEQAWINFLRAVLVSFFRWLAFTTLVLGSISFIIVWNIASQKRQPPRRHAPTYSHASITDVPVVVLPGQSKSLATRVAFSPDGETIAAGFQGENPAVLVWDSATGKPKFSLSGYQWAILDVAFSPNGKYLASSGHDDHAIVFDALTGQVVRRLNGLEVHGNSIAFSADSKRLATGNGNGVQVWDVVSGGQVLDVPNEQDAQHSLKFSPDGRLIAVAGNDWCVRLLDAAEGRELLKFRGHNGEVWGVAFSSDSKHVASASRDSSVKVWDATSGQELVTFTGHSRDVSAVAFSPDGRRAASIGADGFARVRRTDNAWEIRALDIGNRHPFPPFLGITFSPDGKRLATSTGGNTVKLWSVDD